MYLGIDLILQEIERSPISFNNFSIRYLQAIAKEIFTFARDCDRPENASISTTIRKVLHVARALLWTLESEFLAVNQTRLKDLYPTLESYEYMEAQGKLFDRDRVHLLEEYGGLYVHFENGRILDADSDRRNLIKRVRERWCDRLFFIEKV